MTGETSVLLSFFSFKTKFFRQIKVRKFGLKPIKLGVKTERMVFFLKNGLKFCKSLRKIFFENLLTFWQN